MNFIIFSSSKSILLISNEHFLQQLTYRNHVLSSLLSLYIYCSLICSILVGVCMRSKVNFSTASMQFIPFGLLPSAFPLKEFNKAREIQVILNELIHKVAHNHEFLCSALKK